jgi:N-acyl-L-homoserine lactone synthetase
MKDAYQLRHRVFAEKLGQSSLAEAEGQERDQFERPDAVHLIATRCGRVAGYACLMPTVGSRFEAREAGRSGALAPRGLDTYTLGHFCAAQPCQTGGCETCQAGSELVAGIVEWGLACKVSKIVAEIDTYWLQRAQEFQFRAQALGPAEADGRIGATLLEFGPQTLETIRSHRKHWEPVLSYRGEHEIKLPPANPGAGKPRDGSSAPRISH